MYVRRVMLDALVLESPVSLAPLVFMAKALFGCVARDNECFWFTNDATTARRDPPQTDALGAQLVGAGIRMSNDKPRRASTSFLCEALDLRALQAEFLECLEGLTDEGLTNLLPGSVPRALTDVIMKANEAEVQEH
jgi:hypothetical protein